MSTEQNKAIVRRFVEVGLHLEDPHVDELLAPDYVNHLVPGGREALKQAIGFMRSTYPDLKFQGTVDHMIADEDYVAVQITGRFSHAGKQASSSGWGAFRLANGKIVEDWPAGGADMLQQVGVTFPSAPGGK